MITPTASMRPKLVITYATPNGVVGICNSQSQITPWNELPHVQSTGIHLCSAYEKVGIGTSNPSHELTIGISNIYLPTTFSGLFETGLAVGNTTNSSTIYLHNGGATDNVHGVNVYNYETGTYLPLYLGWGTSDVYIAKDQGTVGIGTTDTKGHKLGGGGGGGGGVKGVIICEELKVQLYADWADYVFDPSYQLTELDTLEMFIEENHHLPGVPSASTIKEDGLTVGDMLRIQMEKIEELTLYIIELKKENAEQQKAIESMTDQ